MEEVWKLGLVIPNCLFCWRINFGVKELSFYDLGIVSIFIPNKQTKHEILCRSQMKRELMITWYATRALGSQTAKWDKISQKSQPR